jgi:hypothetical protein
MLVFNGSTSRCHNPDNINLNTRRHEKPVKLSLCIETSDHIICYIVPVIDSSDDVGGSQFFSNQRHPLRTCESYTHLCFSVVVWCQGRNLNVYSGSKRIILVKLLLEWGPLLLCEN